MKCCEYCGRPTASLVSCKCEGCGAFMAHAPNIRPTFRPMNAESMDPEIAKLLAPYIDIAKKDIQYIQKWGMMNGYK